MTVKDTPAALLQDALRRIREEIPNRDLHDFIELSIPEAEALLNEIERRASTPPPGVGGEVERDLAKLLCCPEGCQRLDDCWYDKGYRRLERKQQAEAISKWFLTALAGVREENGRLRESLTAFIELMTAAQQCSDEEWAAIVEKVIAGARVALGQGEK
jgi:hypothetical protein